MKRSALYLLGVVTSCAAAVYACSFPEVQFGDGDGGPAGTSSGTQPGTSSGTSGDPELDSGVILDAGELDIFIDGAVYDANFDAGGKVDAAVGCMVCDCDGDGFLGNDAGCEPAAGMLDCDDFDTRTHPGAGPYPFAPEPPMFGDWNCTGGVEKFPKGNFQCGDIPSALLVGGCAAQGGFTKDNPCGSRGNEYVTCKDPLLGLGNCATDKVGEATQLCQ